MPLYYQLIKKRKIYGELDGIWTRILDEHYVFVLLAINEVQFISRNNLRLSGQWIKPLWHAPKFEIKFELGESVKIIV